MSAERSSLLHDRLVSLNERLVGCFTDASLGAETHRLLDELTAFHRPSKPCGRCGRPFGSGGHGPGFCIESEARRA